jgi:hypothetical protein
MLIANQFNPKYNQGVAIFSQKPTRRIVKFDLHGNLAEAQYAEVQYDSDLSFKKKNYSFKGNFFLSMPHILYRIVYTKRPKGSFQFYQMNVVFTNSNHTKIYYPALPNIGWSNCTVCIPFGRKTYSDVESLCKDVVVKFWATTFSDSLYDSYKNYGFGNLLSDPRKWQEKTKSQPNWIPNARNLVEYKRSYNEFCQFFKLENDLFDDDDDDDDDFLDYYDDDDDYY